MSETQLWETQSKETWSNCVSKEVQLQRGFSPSSGCGSGTARVAPVWSEREVSLKLLLVNFPWKCFEQ